MIRITRTLTIPEKDIEEKFILASGPGGQNVNKIASAVQLRFDVDSATSLPDDVKKRLKVLAHNQITTDGILIIEAQTHRTQSRNRKAAREKFIYLIRKALKRPVKRHNTQPTKTSQERRLNNKKIRARKKQLRQHPPHPD